jgi:hypothetical protein
MNWNFISQAKPAEYLQLALVGAGVGGGGVEFARGGEGGGEQGGLARRQVGAGLS